MGFYEEHDEDVNHLADKNKLSDAEKIKMCDILMDTCAAYEIPLNNIEDAENFWELIRYGYTHAEREEQAALYGFILKKHYNLFKEMDEYYKELRKQYPLLPDSAFDYKKGNRIPDKDVVHYLEQAITLVKNKYPDNLYDFLDLVRIDEIYFAILNKVTVDGFVQAVLY